MLSKTLNSPPRRSTLEEGEVVLLSRIIPPPLRSSPYVRGTILRLGQQLYYYFFLMVSVVGRNGQCILRLTTDTGCRWGVGR